MKEIIINDNILLSKIYAEADKRNMSPQMVVYEILQNALKDVKVETKPLSKPKAVKKRF